MSRLIRVQEVKEVIEAPRRSRGRANPTRLAFSSGSTLLNLALSDNPFYGFVPGTEVNIIGDSAAGKTFLLWSIFAEVCHDKRFADYKIYYDEPEVAMEFDIAKLFGKVTQKQVDRSIISDTVEDFHDNVMKLAKKGNPFIYGLDSFDALTSEAELKKDIRDGSFGTDKAKKSGEVLRKTIRMFDNTDSILFVISQTRDKIGVMFGNKKTRAGGHALKFYATHELWLSVEGHVKRRDRDVGVDVIVKVTKNKLTGKLRTVAFPIYYDYGIDDITSMVNWLLDEGVWKWERRKKGEEAEEGKKENIRVRKIDSQGWAEAELYPDIITEVANNEQKLYDLKTYVHAQWLMIEKSIATERKPRYA